MCDTTFAFSQRGGHFVQCLSNRETTRLPPKLASLLSSPQLQQVHHVALGFEDSFLITWRDKKGQGRIDSQGLPLELIEFLYARDAQQELIRDIAGIRCTLGPYNSTFFAHDGSAYRWMNLPTELLTELESKITQGEWSDRPRIVALGANNNFVLITEKHTATWSLRNYPTGSKFMEYSRQQGIGIAEIHSLVLHAYRYDGFVSQARNGTLIHNSLPPHAISGIQAMVPLILQHTEETQRKPLARRESDKRETLQRKASALQKRAQFRKDWGEHTREFTAQSKGIKLSLSLSVSAAGLTRFLR